MTEEELAAIETRCDAATRGPWLLDDSGDIYSAGGTYTKYDREGYLHTEWNGAICIVDSGVYPPWGDDAAFIAHAREDIPALIAEVRRLQAEIAEASDLLYTYVTRPEDKSLPSLVRESINNYRHVNRQKDDFYCRLQDIKRIADGEEARYGRGEAPEVVA